MRKLALLILLVILPIAMFIGAWIEWSFRTGIFAGLATFIIAILALVWPHSADEDEEEEEAGHCVHHIHHRSFRCPNCGGTGRVPSLYFPNSQARCLNCKGSGRIWD